MGAMGTVQVERKLGYFEVVLSGHMLPQFVPKVRFSRCHPLFQSGRLIAIVLLGCVPKHAVAPWNQAKPLNCNIPFVIPFIPSASVDDPYIIHSNTN